MTLGGVGCVSHPGLPATSDDPYHQKSVLTAEAAQSAVATVALALDGLAGRRVTAVYLDSVVSDQEEILAGVTGSFSSITPPSDRSSRLRVRVLSALDEAAGDVAEVRIAVRQGQPDRAVALRSALDRDADAFEVMAS